MCVVCFCVAVLYCCVHVVLHLSPAVLSLSLVYALQWLPMQLFKMELKLFSTYLVNKFVDSPALLFNFAFTIVHNGTIVNNGTGKSKQ